MALQLGFRPASGAKASVERENAYSRMLEFEAANALRGNRSRMERYTTLRAYYDGDNAPPEDVDQPLHVNYVQAINQKHNKYLWGQVDEGKDIVVVRAEPIATGGSVPDALREKGQKITRYVQRRMRQNKANILFYQTGLNSSILGDGFLRPIFDDRLSRCRWEQILPNYIHVRWSPVDLNDVQEVIVSYPIARADAYALYGTGGNPTWASLSLIDPRFSGFGVYWERWTYQSYQQWIDDEVVRDDPNPYQGAKVGVFGEAVPLSGVIPLVHFPNMQVGGDYYGYADCEPGLGLQDELNRRVADQGDAINNFAHPITLLRKYYDPLDQLPVGPDKMWDLGREGEAEYLQWKGSPPDVKEFVDRVLQILFDTTAMSPVAFGRAEGTQQSSVALTVKMMPTIERAQWKRMLWSEGIRELVLQTILIEERSGLSHEGFTYEDLEDFELQIEWAPMLPKDRLELVQEVIQRFVNFLISPEAALEKLGEIDPDVEWKAILAGAKKLADIGVKLQGQAAVGSSSTPGGIAKSTASPAPKGRPTGSTKSGD